MTLQEPSDVPMSAIDPRFWLRLVLGLFVLAAAVFGLAVMGWLFVCVVNAHWTFDVWRTPHGIVSLIGGGLIFGLPILMALFFVGAFAFAIGDAILDKDQPNDCSGGREVRS